MTVFGNRYEILRRLGTGGWGDVWRAHDRHLKRDVALKTFRVSTDLSVATYEGQILTTLSGRHVLQVFDAAKYQDIPYLTMEIAAQGSVKDHLEPFGIRQDRACRWIRDMLIGLVVCHEHGLLHRDVSPGNMFLQSEDLALLGDFGIAAQMDSAGGTDAHGAWDIRAPECYTTGRMSVASDVYSAGVTLYTLLVGKNPFDRGSTPETVKAVVERDFQPLREAAPHLSRTLAARIETAMALDPSERYATASAFHDALGNVPLPKRLLQRTPPHAGHRSCWRGSNSGGEREIDVCVWDIGGRDFEVEARHARKGRARVLKCCGTVHGAKQLGVFLRRAFDVLSR
jgi:serine/threonine protein kinase